MAQCSIGCVSFAKWTLYPMALVAICMRGGPFSAQSAGFFLGGVVPQYVSAEVTQL